jgi:hypothetical protein
MRAYDPKKAAQYHDEIHAHVPSESALRVKALESLLVEKGLVDFQPRKMRPVEALARAHVQSHAMQRKRVVFPDESELRVGDASGAHIVFGMDFEECHGLRGCGDGGEMLRVESGAGPQGKL